MRVSVVEEELCVVIGVGPASDVEAAPDEVDEGRTVMVEDEPLAVATEVDAAAESA